MMENMFRRVSAILFCASMFLLSTTLNANAYEGIDECTLMQTAIVENKTKLSLEEPYIQKGRHFGLELYFTHEEDPEIKKLQVIQVFPQIHEWLEELGVDPSEIQAEYPIEINGLESSEVNENLWHEFSKRETLNLKFRKHPETIEFKKIDYSLVKSDSVWVLFDKLDDINTSKQSFFAKFTVISQWRDERLAPYGKQIVEKIEKADPEGFEEFGGQFFVSQKQHNFSTRLALTYQLSRLVGLQVQ